MTTVVQRKESSAVRPPPPYSFPSAEIVGIESGSGESHLGKYSVVVPADAKPGDTLTIRVPHLPSPAAPSANTPIRRGPGPRNIVKKKAFGLGGLLRVVGWGVLLPSFVVAWLAFVIEIAPLLATLAHEHNLEPTLFQHFAAATQPAREFVGAGAAREYVATRLAAAARLMAHDTESAMTLWQVCRTPLELVERTLDDVWRQTYVMQERLFAIRSQFQTVEVFQSASLGRVLTLDGVVQFSERFEANYHELMGHLPVNILLGPHGVSKSGRDVSRHGLRVLILGGGDGGVATRMLLHREVAEVTLVEIDRTVVDTSGSWFSPTVNAAFRDPRMRFVFSDATAWVRNESIRLSAMAADERQHAEVDVVVVDTTDWSLGGAWSLEFYVTLSTLLSPYSLVIANLDTPLLTSRAVTPAVGALKTVFDHVHLITVMQPEFVTGTYCFMVASKGVDTRRAPVAWDKWKAKGLATKYYNQDMHSAAFAMPEYLQRAIDIL